MNVFEKTIGHTKTILKHKIEVCKICFKFGLYWQGIIHDNSKFSPIEFFNGIKYYQGDKSPIEAEKQDKGYSMGWAHHHNKNKHHWLYWIDFNNVNEVSPMRMPYKYALEAIADWIGAGKVYSKNAGKVFEWDEPYEYYKKNTRVGSDKNIHYQTRQLWDIILFDLKCNGIDYVSDLIKNGYYKQIYDTPKTKNGKYTIFKQDEYNNLILEHYSD